MEKVRFTMEIPTVIKVSGGEYDKERDFSPIEIETQGLHIIFDLPGKYESRGAQKRLAEGIRRLSVKKMLHLANTQLWPVIQQLP